MEENKQLSDKQTFLKSITSLNDKSRIAELEEMISSDETCKSFVRFIHREGYERVSDTHKELYHNKERFIYKSLNELYERFIELKDYSKKFRENKKEKEDIVDSLRTEYKQRGLNYYENPKKLPDDLLYVYTKEYTEWLEKKVVELKKQLSL